MFWIHGGAFYLSHGGSNIFGPDYFMDKNVVLVSVNYRLGALGQILHQIIFTSELQYLYLN